MCDADYQRLLEDLKALTPEQAVDLQRAVHLRIADDLYQRALATTPNPDAEALADLEGQRRMFEEGIVSEIKPPIRVDTGTHRFEPITIQGEPLSETILRERR